MSNFPTTKLTAASVLLCGAALFSASPLFAQDAVKTMDSFKVEPAERAEQVTPKVEPAAVEAAPEVEPAAVEATPEAEPAAPETTDKVAGMIDTPTDETHKKVFEAFRVRLPGVPIESLSEAPYPGLYEVITDAQVIYVNEDVSLLFQGEMIDLATGINLTETRLTGIHMGLINDLGEENMLVYKSSEPSDRSITVFTDINCGYCRLLHGEIETLLEGGVNVRYLMFPRAGLDSDSRIALESVWCADDPQAAMTAAKAGDPIAPKTCKTPIEEHVALAQQVGLRGTPLIYLDNGTAIPGYREAKIIVEMINSTEPVSN